jgi:hypothetical protein
VERSVFLHPQPRDGCEDERDSHLCGHVGACVDTACWEFPIKIVSDDPMNVRQDGTYGSATSNLFSIDFNTS